MGTGVEGVKHSRGKESALHKASAGLFYKLISSAVKIDMSRASDFKLLDRKAVNALLDMPERNVFFRALSSWIGYRKTTVEFDVQERTEGESKWSTWSLIKYAVTNVVVDEIADQVRRKKYCFVFDGADAVCDGGGRVCVPAGDRAWHSVTGAVFQRTCRGRLYDGNPADPDHWQHHYDQPRYYWILYREDL